MSSSQHTSPTISRQTSPARRLSRSLSPDRRRSVSCSRDSRSISRSRSRSRTPSPRRRDRSCSHSSDEDEDIMDRSKYQSLTLKGRRAYARRAKERNSMLEHTLVSLLQTLYKERIELARIELTNTRVKQSVERGIARDLELATAVTTTTKRPRSPSPVPPRQQRSPPRCQRSPLPFRERSRSPLRKRTRDCSPPRSQSHYDTYPYPLQQQHQLPQQQRRGNRGGSGSRRNRQRNQESSTHSRPQAYEPLKIDISRSKAVNVRLNTDSINQIECDDK